MCLQCSALLGTAQCSGNEGGSSHRSPCWGDILGLPLGLVLGSRHRDAEATGSLRNRAGEAHTARAQSPRMESKLILQSLRAWCVAVHP